MVGHACPGPLGGEGTGFRSNVTSNRVISPHSAVRRTMRNLDTFEERRRGFSR